jgi:hypothetical protein
MPSGTCAFTPRIRPRSPLFCRLFQLPTSPRTLQYQSTSRPPPARPRHISRFSLRWEVGEPYGKEIDAVHDFIAHRSDGEEGVLKGLDHTLFNFQVVAEPAATPSEATSDWAVPFCPTTSCQGQGHDLCLA